jgi:hypothetical protein
MATRAQKNLEKEYTNKDTMQYAMLSQLFSFLGPAMRRDFIVFNYNEEKKKI